MSLRIVPVYRDPANAFIAAWHRHHAPPLRFLYAIGIADGDLLVGVATAGRPVARGYDDGLTVEVTRVAVADNTPNGCSMLYGACWRAAKARGFVRALTYTRDDEAGASLRAAGWICAAHRDLRVGWDMPGRPRDNTAYDPIGRYLRVAGAWARTEDGRLVADPAHTLPSRKAAPAGAGPAADPLTLFAEGSAA
jgi:hypothetical protein